MSEVLKKPVHLAILKPTHLQKLAAENRLPTTAYSVSVPEQPDLPTEQVEKPYSVPKLNLPSTDLVKKSNKQMRLRMYYDRIPLMPKEKVPPCETCKVAPCCTAFVVNITKDEYESGFYGDAAIELTLEIQKQLNNQFLQFSTLGVPTNNSKTSYFLESKIGEPCPFLTTENQCGIYDIRPATCRVYTCVGDDRITPSMRDGTSKMDLISLLTGKSTDAK